MAEKAELGLRNGPSELAVMAPYRYALDPLPTRQHIRVLVLQPGPKDDDKFPLSGSMKLLDLRDENSEPFEAISYVWGRCRKSRVILVDGQLLRITRSLRRALLQTRLPDQPRRLWADAICIDQSNRKEKGYQVAAMGRIYEKSFRTLICLGIQAPDNAQHAAGIVNEVNLMVQNVRQDPDFSGEPGIFPYPAKSDPIAHDHRWELGWDVMLEHQWFTRGWVLQEASLAPDACVLWASVQIDWTAILRVAYWLNRRGNSAIQSQGGRCPTGLPLYHISSLAHRHPDEVRLFDEDPQNEIMSSTLVTLFTVTRLEVTDPRDRIYAVMALHTSDGVLAGLQLKPDYERPFEDTYHEFAVKYIEKTRDMTIFLFISHNKESLTSSPMVEAIPSWVPRWDLEHSWGGPSILKTKMGDQPKAFAFKQNYSVMQVRGLVLGCVEYAAAHEPYCLDDQSSRSPTLQNVISLWKEVLSASDVNDGPYKGRQALTFFNLVFANSPFDHSGKWSTRREDFVRHLQSYMPGPEREPSILVSQSSELMKEQRLLKIFANQIGIKGRRRFVILSRGYYGSAPLITQKGDVLALIYGSETLSILRPAKDNPSYYQVVGPVHVESKTVKYTHWGNMMGGEGCRDWEEWGLTEQDINLC